MHAYLRTFPNGHFDDDCAQVGDGYLLLDAVRINPDQVKSGRHNK